MDIRDFQNRCMEGKIKWSVHAAARILQRGISREDIIHCIMHGEIIEEYPNYWLNPACLIFGYSINNKIIHVVVGIDTYIHIITAYYPNTEKFQKDLKTRRS